jgi:PAS domain S-box-containing protein
MGAKPTYKELELKIEELERKALERKLSEEAFQASTGFLDTLVSSVMDGVIVYDDKFRYKLWNKFMEKLTGIRAENVLGEIAFDLFPHLREEGIDKLLERALAGETVQSDDTPYHVPDTGEVGWVTGLYSPHVDPSGDIVGVVAIVHDISGRKLAEDMLRESEERHRLLLEVSPDPIVLYDIEGKTSYVNRAFEQTFGWSLDELREKRIDFVPEENWPETKEAIDRMLQGLKIQLFETRRLTKDGRILDIQLSSALFFGRDEKPAGNIVIFRDITAQKRAEEILRNAHDELEQRVKERTAELVLINENLQQEIEDRQHAEAELVKSKAMFKAVVESLPFDVFVIDPDNRYILQNSICKKNWGDLIGKSPEDLTLNKKTKDLWMENNRRALSGETVTGEVVYDRLDGGKNFYYNIIAPICDGKKILGIVGVLVDISDLKQAEALLRESELKLSAMLSSIGDHMSMMDKNLNIIWANEIAGKIFGNDIIGKKCYEVYHKRTEPCEPYPCITLRTFQDGKIHKHDTQVIDQDGKTIFFHCTANVGLRDKEGKPTAVLEISRDITEKVRAEKALHKAKNELERRVKERTRELGIKTNSLEEINTAMKILLKKREEDKTELEDNVLTNVKKIVEPYFKKIKKTKLDEQQETLLSIIESNLKEIISPFTRKMSLKHLNLTPTEILIANLIRLGSSSKKIAELQNVSPRTIDTHRKNIRRKIGLQGQRGNLRSYLLSLH